ncbi:MAG: cupin domain-containing protein, partial [Betaproteobacteria bacterium]
MSTRTNAIFTETFNTSCTEHRGLARSTADWATTLVAALAIALSGCASLHADNTMVMLTPDKLQWGDPILPGSPLPAFEKGAKVAVLQGVPGSSGPVVVRLKFPANFVISPHWHSTDEVITVLEGTLHAGMGDKLDR